MDRGSMPTVDRPSTVSQVPARREDADAGTGMAGWVLVMLCDNQGGNPLTERGILQIIRPMARS
jgi:hypothetical protein